MRFPSLFLLLLSFLGLCRVGLLACYKNRPQFYRADARLPLS
jgi:hypothetical protein